MVRDRRDAKEAHGFVEANTVTVRVLSRSSAAHDLIVVALAVEFVRTRTLDDPVCRIVVLPDSPRIGELPRISPGPRIMVYTNIP